MSVDASVGKDGEATSTPVQRHPTQLLADPGLRGHRLVHGALDTFVVNVAIPSLRNELGATPSEAEFVVTAYALTLAVLLITGGRLGDLVGRVRVYLIGMAVFTVASALCTVAHNPAFLIGARIVQAAGGPS